jgi:hypothetical protein
MSLPGRRGEPTLRVPRAYTQDTTRHPPAATDGSQSFLAWRDRNGQLARASSTNGQDFSNPVVLNATTKAAPALACRNDTLLVAWANNDRRLRLGRQPTLPPSGSSSNSGRRGSGRLGSCLD